MNIFIVLAHPEPRSFNASMFHLAVNTLQKRGHNVETSELNKMAFPPVSDSRNFTHRTDANFLNIQREEQFAMQSSGFDPKILNEMEKVKRCDIMIWQFPLWWFGVPAILKGWIDRIFAAGFAYGGGKMYESGKFSGKRAMLSTTTGAGKEAYQTNGFQGNMNKILWPIHHGILEFTGFEVLDPHVVYNPKALNQVQIQEEFRQFERRLEKVIA